MRDGFLAVAAAIALFAAAWHIVTLRAEIAALRRTTVARSAPLPRPSAQPGSLTPAQRETLRTALRVEQSVEQPVWFATSALNPGGRVLQGELQTLFEEAGWQVKGNSEVPFRLKAGIFVFSADLEPPPYVGVVIAALEDAGFSVSSGRGYREYYTERKRENPSWNGFPMEPEQTYVVAVGGMPPAGETAEGP